MLVKTGIILDTLLYTLSTIELSKKLSIPVGADDVKVRNALLNEFNIEIGGGLGPFAGKVWRIGLMGHSAYEKNVDTLMYNRFIKRKEA